MLKKIRKFIWRFRYAREMRRVIKCEWEFAFQSVRAMQDDMGGFPDEDPIDAVHIELSYWTD